MRIACLTHYYIEENRAGGELMLHALLSSLAAAGHDVTAYITDTIRLNTAIDGVKVVYGVRAEAVLFTAEFDAVVTQFQNGGFAMEAAKRLQKPLIYIAHNDSWQTDRTIQLLHERDLVVFNTEWLQRKMYRSRAPKIVVHPPIDRKAFKTKSSREYVTLVNLTKAKGVDIFYELARRMPDVQFLGVRGGYWKDQQQTIKLPNVTTIDMTADMRRDVYAKSDVVLMPSVYETFGMVAAEAICSGIPVIAAPTPGLKENLGDAGIYAHRGSGDVFAWQQALEQLLNDPNHYKEVSKAALKQSKMIDTPGELKAFVKAVEALQQ